MCPFEHLGREDLRGTLGNDTDEQEEEEEDMQLACWFCNWSHKFCHRHKIKHQN